MASVNYIREILGERLKETKLQVADTQIVLSEPKEIGLGIWRNDERAEKRFEIQIEMPWQNFYTIARYESKEEASRAYKELVEQLKHGQAKIAIGKSFSIVP